MATRIHKKRQGYLCIKDDGSARFLTFCEVVMYRLFGVKP